VYFFLPKKLRGYIWPSGRRALEQRQGKNARLEAQADASVDMPVLPDVLREIEGIASPAPDDPFVSQLKTVALKAHSGEAPRGQTYERSCAATSHSWYSRRRDYLVYVPSGYDENEALPVVVVLHGCRQTHEDIRAISGFDAIAESELFIVVYPFVTTYWGSRHRNCWAWWVSQHVNAGSGEVEDIGRIVQQVQDEFSVDPQRIHITGLSSGAGMTVAALVAHGALFASGASVAGVAYGETASAVKVNSLMPAKHRSLGYIVERMRTQLNIVGRGRLAPLLVIQSEADEMVEMQSAFNLRDSWLEVKETDLSMIQRVNGQTRQVRWQYEHYGDSVGFLMTEQLPHCWIGGLPGEYSDARGPNISEAIWLYFKSTSMLRSG